MHGGREGCVFQVGTIDEVVERHQPIEIDRALRLKEVLARERKLAEQKLDHVMRAVMGGFEPNLIAVAARGKFALQRSQQVLGVVFFHQQVAVATFCLGSFRACLANLSKLAFFVSTGMPLYSKRRSFVAAFLS